MTPTSQGLVYLISTDTGINHGLVRQQEMVFGYYYTLTWSGETFSLENSTQSSAVAISPYISPFTMASGDVFSGLYMVPGTITDGNGTHPTKLIFSGETWTVDAVILTYDGKPNIYSLEDLEGFDFVPTLEVNGAAVEMSPLTLSASDPLEWVGVSAPAGNYEFEVLLKDVYDNSSTDSIAFTIQTPF